jgi:DNA-binding HxlR family transcriptional regulator
MTGTPYRQFCALARAAEIVGERWTLLIIRELLISPRRFGDLLAHLAGMSPTLLTTRLASLMESGVVRKVAWPGPVAGQVYELTDSGRQLQPAIRELIRWGGRFLFPPRPGDEFEPDWVLLGLDAIARRTPVPAVSVGLVVTHGRKAATFTVAGGQNGTIITRGDAGSRATLEAPFDAVLQIIGKRISLDKALADNRARLQGPAAPVRKLPLLFDLAERVH